MVAPEKDTGSFVHALIRSPPGLNLLGYGQMMSLREYMAVWSRVMGIGPATYEEIPLADMEKTMPSALARELGEMCLYMAEFGYDGSDPTIVHPADLGVECPTTSMEEYIKQEDWSHIIKS
ncbi:hypothetical protein SLS56_011957 [Neofusicoccum ribis]|uniref:NmrA-like domain-containing protein n=1 Tax=Neofusicoccum ribis TaxID=45134 RepID=A0ABR3SAT4_9PEZI